MAIIRFLDAKENCYQVHTPDHPVLIYLTEHEREQLSNSQKGDCLMLIDKTLSEEEIQRKASALNTKEDPKMLS